MPRSKRKVCHAKRVLGTLCIFMGLNMRKCTFEHEGPVKTKTSLIRVFAMRSLNSQESKVSSSEQRRDWSGCAEAQADRSLRFGTPVKVHFFHFEAHIY